MKRTKVQEILPAFLIEKIQDYVQGEVIYIPKQKAAYKTWGSCSGTRSLIDQRNVEISMLFQQGKSMEELSNEYYLSLETIRKIIYNKGTSKS